MHWLVRGWVAGAGGPPRISVRDVSGSLFSTRIMRISGADVEAALPAFRALRFELETDCTWAGCELLIESEGQAPRAFPIPAVQQGSQFLSGDAAAFLDTVEQRGPLFGAARGTRQHLQLAIARRIGGAYATLVPILSAVAVAGLALAALGTRFRPQSAAIVGLGLACAAGVASRVALLAYLDVTSMPTLFQVYASPASPLLLTFAFVGLYAGSTALLPYMVRLRGLQRNFASDESEGSVRARHAR